MVPSLSERPPPTGRIRSPRGHASQRVGHGRPAGMPLRPSLRSWHRADHARRYAFLSTPRRGRSCARRTSVALACLSPSTARSLLEAVQDHALVGVRLTHADVPALARLVVAAERRAAGLRSSTSCPTRCGCGSRRGSRRRCTGTSRRMPPGHHRPPVEDEAPPPDRGWDSIDDHQVYRFTEHCQEVDRRPPGRVPAPRRLSRLGPSPGGGSGSGPAREPRRLAGEVVALRGAGRRPCRHGIQVRGLCEVARPLVQVCRDRVVPGHVAGSPRRAPAARPAARRPRRRATARLSATTGLSVMLRELVVPLEDLGPVGLRRRPGVGVQGRDGRLGLVLAEPVPGQRVLQDRGRPRRSRSCPTATGPGRRAAPARRPGCGGTRDGRGAAASAPAARRPRARPSSWPAGGSAGSPLPPGRPHRCSPR